MWLVRRPGSPESAQHTLEFERNNGWRFLGGGSSSAREISLDRRPEAPASGPASMMRLVSSSASRSRIDRERPAGGLRAAEAGWVACAGFRVAAEVAHLQAAGRSIPVPGHGYVIVAWRSPPALTRPLIAAVSNNRSVLSELGPHDLLDSLSWESIEQALADDPLPPPRPPG